MNRHFEGWDLINEILMNLEEELEATREDNRRGLADYKVNKGRKQGLKNAIYIIRETVYDREGV